MESYPRQCRSAEGKTFVSGTDFLEVNLNASCSNNTDCMLVDKKLGFGCCYAGACQPIDYAEKKWIALNKEWFQGIRAKHCPSPADCGPAPLCAVRVVNDNYLAKCVRNVCTKAQKT
jgi:hypothetical protein